MDYEKKYFLKSKDWRFNNGGFTKTNILFKNILIYYL